MGLRALADDEDGAETEEVRFLPALDFNLAKPHEPVEGQQVMPCFPLGGTTYLPDSEHMLNIFEPRYREMYNDILLSGGRRFVVPQTREGQDGMQLAEVGVVFYLSDLQEVSEQTQDQVKYVCTHRVVGRVKLRRVLNPQAFADRSTYLRVEVDDVVDTDAGMDTSGDEEKLMTSFREVTSLQRQANDASPFSLQALNGHNATRSPGFWNLAGFWQENIMLRLGLINDRFERSLQEKIRVYYEAMSPDKMRSMQISFSDLPEELQKEVVQLTKKRKEEMDPFIKVMGNTVQLLIQTDSHTRRLELLRGALDQERKLLEAKIAIKAVFDD